MEITKLQIFFYTILILAYGVKTADRIIFADSGTIKPNPNFDVQLASARLLRAVSGWGTDEEAIISILTTHDLAQRKKIASYYKQYHRRYLVEDLKDDTSGCFERALVSLFKPADELNSYWLHRATKKKIGTDEMTMIAILTSQDGAGISSLRDFYDSMYPTTLSEVIEDELSGDFKELMLQLASPVRQSEGQVNRREVKEDAKELAGRRDASPIRDVFFRIFSTRSFAQLKVTFEEYRKVTYWDVRDRIREKFSSLTQTALLAIVDRAEDVPNFFAQWLHYSMKGLGTNDNLLTWILVARSEIDLEDINKAYVNKYERMISYDVRRDTRSYYEDLLLNILKPQL